MKLKILILLNILFLSACDQSDSKAQENILQQQKSIIENKTEVVNDALKNQQSELEKVQ